MSEKINFSNFYAGQMSLVITYNSIKDQFNEYLTG